MEHKFIHTAVFQSWLKGLAEESGKILLKYFRQSFLVQQKENDKGPVTEADFASEKFIISEIKKRFPDHAILGEESGLTEVVTSNSAYIWILDPLDGTTNFSRGNPYFCVSISLCHKSEKGCQVLAGAILQPTTGDLYFSTLGSGVCLNGKPMKVSTHTELKTAYFATGFSYNRGHSLQQVSEMIFAVQSKDYGTTVRVNGAAALDLAWVAQGLLDGFWEKSLAPWDMAAASLMVQEAGGVVTNFNNEPFDTLRDANIIAGSPTMHGALQKIIGQFLDTKK